MKKYIAATLLAISCLSTSFAQQSDVDPISSTQSQCIVLTSSNLRIRARDSITNNEVSLLQSFLQDIGLLASEPTGMFGNATLAAVKAFQTQKGLSPTGYVGPLTRAKIQEVSCGASSTVSTASTVSTISTTSSTTTGSGVVVGPATPVVFTDESVSNGAVIIRLITRIVGAGPNAKACVGVLPRRIVGGVVACSTDTQFALIKNQPGWSYNTQTDTYSINMDVTSIQYPDTTYFTKILLANGQKVEQQWTPKKIAVTFLPTASLTVNGGKTATLRVGEANTKTWSSTGGTSWRSTYAFSGSSCALAGVTGVWGANSESGSESVVPTPDSVNCTATITYFVSNGLGTVNDSITIVVLPATTASTSTTQATAAGVPTITNISSPGQAAGTVVAGAQATITGTGFSGNITVLYGGATTILGTAQNDTTATFTVPSFTTYPNSSLFTVTNSQGKTSAPYRVTTIVPPPTASITVNGVHNITLRVGEVNTKTWSSTGGTSWRSTYAFSGSSCALAGRSGEWTANSASGLESVVPTSDFAGCTATITYTVTNTSGSASDSINVTVEAQAPVLPTASITVNGGKSATLYPGQANTKVWSSAGGTSWRSTYAFSGSCAYNGLLGAWTAVTANGSESIAATDDFVGCSALITYFVSNSAGTVSDSITITVVPRPVAQVSSHKGQVLGASAVLGCVDLKNKMFLGTRDIFVENEVSELQTFLQKKGYLNELPSGYFGPVTESAVKAFQKDNNLIVTGVAGKVTRDIVQKLSCSAH